MTEFDLEYALNKIDLRSHVYDSLPFVYRQFIKNCMFYGVSNNVKSPFKDGDILVRRNINNNQLITDSYNVVEKWLYAGNIFGLILGSKLIGFSKKGSPKLGKTIVLNEVNLNIQPEVDPEYIEAIFLSEGEYDPLAHKKKILELKKKAKEYNNKISKYIGNIDDAHDFMNSISKGDRVWFSKSNLSLTTNPFYFEVLKKIHNKNQLSLIEVNPSSKNYYGLVVKPYHIIDMYVTTEEPFRIDSNMRTS